MDLRVRELIDELKLERQGDNWVFSFGFQFGIPITLADSMQTPDELRGLIMCTLQKIFTEQMGGIEIKTRKIAQTKIQLVQAIN